MHRWLVALALATALFLAIGPTAQGVGEQRYPTVSGPVTGGTGEIALRTTSFDLASVGYQADEYFLEGTATAYAPAQPFGPDGKWKVTTSSTAPYKTRIVVYRPIDPQDFNGTVFVEWLNVSVGFDASPDWGAAHNEIIRSGAAWVGVSAQMIGVQGAPPYVAGSSALHGVKGTDPARYGTLSHPGDAYSYDIFTQAAEAVRTRGRGGPLGDLDVQRVIALGESQSAFRLVTYINAVHPLAHAYDGFLVHSRAASGAGLGLSLDRGFNDPGMPSTAVIRRDNTTPVLTLETESDLTYLGYLPSRQADSKHFRLWEVAGSAHGDAYTIEGWADTGDGAAEARLLDPAHTTRGVFGCTTPINKGPTFAVVSAAIHRLERWVRDGTAPPKARRLETAGGAITRDEYGNALGGIRTGQLEAPLEAVSGESNGDDGWCVLFGATVPLDTATVAARFPTKAAYLTAFDRATDAAVKAGFLLVPEALHYAAAADSLALPAWS